MMTMMLWEGHFSISGQEDTGTWQSNPGRAACMAEQGSACLLPSLLGLNMLHGAAGICWERGLSLYNSHFQPLSCGKLLCCKWSSDVPQEFVSLLIS